MGTNKVGEDRIFEILLDLTDEASMVKAEKNIIIEMFFETLNQKPEILQYINLDEAREKLLTNINNIEYNSELSNGVNGAYCCFETKDIKISKNLWRIEDLQSVTVHEMLHALTTRYSSVGVSNIGVTYINNDCERGRGLNEGITQWLTNKLVDRYVPIDGGYISCLRGLRDDAYPLEQTLASELAILYGEDNVIKTYLNNDIEILTNEMDKNQLFGRSKETFSDFLDLADVINEVSSCDSKESKNELNVLFRESQDYFVGKFLKKEIKYALSSKDNEKIAIMRDKLQELVNLDVSIDGGKNLFNGVASSFNKKVKKLGKEFEVEIQKESLLERVQNTFVDMKLQFFEGIENVTYGIEKLFRLHNEVPKALAQANSVGENETYENSTISSIDNEKLLSAIRGMNSEEYEKACDKSTLEWEQHQNKNKENMQGFER